ncbi:hypothetical protein, partial [Desulfobacula sp.]|uniref:hypothetical protein n=1 Tax=Desulfobacula sp. TaxID=2593537 RepID=UPI0025BFAA6C
IGVLLWYEKSLKGFLKKACHTVLSVVLTKGYKMESDNKSNIKPRLCYGIVIALGGFSYMGLTLYGYNLS